MPEERERAASLRTLGDRWSGCRGTGIAAPVPRSNGGRRCAAQLGGPRPPRRRGGTHGHLLSSRWPPESVRRHGGTRRPPLVFDPQSKRTAKLPTGMMQLYRDLDRENEYAFNHRMAGEDDSKGYSLSVYPPARVLELNLHEIRSHEFLHPDQNSPILP